jgi:hypothetical protein
MERRKMGNESLLCMDLRGKKKRLLTNEFAARRIVVLSHGSQWVEVGYSPTKLRCKTSMGKGAWIWLGERHKVMR